MQGCCTATPPTFGGQSVAYHHGCSPSFGYCRLRFSAIGGSQVSKLNSLPVISSQSFANKPTRHCNQCLNRVEPKVREAAMMVSREFLQGTEPWVIGFSGGKDSTAVLRLVYAAMLSNPSHCRPVTIVYCDTGVDIPLIAKHVRQTLGRLQRESAADGLDLKVRLARPPTTDSFFVRVIGRGYPPPTNKFRWCTDKLRINPVRRVVQHAAKDGIVVL